MWTPPTVRTVEKLSHPSLFLLGVCLIGNRGGRFWSLNREGESIYIEKYFPLLAKDIDESAEALAATLPEQVRLAIEDERRKLLALNAVLTGEDGETVLRKMRARLRWARTRMAGERDAVKRKKLEHEVSDLEAQIKKEAERQKSLG